MFCDLDKVDIVYERADGAKVGVQTDHRDAATLEADIWRTIVFTLARIIRPLASDLDIEAMEVVFPEPPPARLRAAIEAAGARVRTDDGLLEPAHEVDEARADALAAEALEAIGRAALARIDAAVDEAGLKALEADRAKDFEAYDEWPEELRYTAVLELGAAAGEVQRALHGGRWVRDHGFEHELPFTVERDRTRSNLFGRASRFFEESVDEGPSVLLRTALEGPSDGEILPLLRKAGYGTSTSAPPSRPLLPGAKDVEDMPHVYLVQDRPESVAYIQDLEPEDFEALLEASLENLRRRAIRPARLSDDVPVFLIEGDFFAASKLLDRGLLAGLAETLDTELLMVAAPAVQAALVAPLTGDMALTGGFLALVQSTYEEAAPSARLSPLVFAATPSAGVQGLLRLADEDDDEDASASDAASVEEASAGAVDEAEDAPAPKPWWKKLFGS